MPTSFRVSSLLTTAGVLLPLLSFGAYLGIPINPFALSIHLPDPFPTLPLLFLVSLATYLLIQPIIINITIPHHPIQSDETTRSRRIVSMIATNLQLVLTIYFYVWLVQTRWVCKEGGDEEEHRKDKLGFLAGTTMILVCGVFVYNVYVLHKLFPPGEDGVYRFPAEQAAQEEKKDL